MHRKEFIRNVTYGTLPVFFPVLQPTPLNTQADYIMTVNGSIPADKIGFTLSHEHILVDFIGADSITPSRYNVNEVYKKVLPFLKKAGEQGCSTIMECTPDYLGRNPVMLQQLSKASGLHIVTNAGYYGAAKEKFLPEHAYTESAQQLAERWIKEFNSGIADTGIKPGFIKTGVDSYPLSAVQQKLIQDAALTHLATGLTIGVHTGNGAAAMEELRILKGAGVSAAAWMWIHAQNESDHTIHIRVAKSGGWVSFDGLSNENIADYVAYVKEMKAADVLHKTLISHDAGWYNVGEPNGGNYRSYETVFTLLIPALLKEGFSDKEIKQIFISNPTQAFAIKVKKLSS
jgi:predicted metal-dependent phosphotriesterase family hydrolase